MINYLLFIMLIQRSSSFTYVNVFVLLLSMLLLLLQIQFVYCEQQRSLNMTNNNNNNNNNTFEYFVKTYLSNGTMNNAYLSYTEYLEFLNLISSSFPNTTTLSSLGFSYNNNSIPLLTISNKTQFQPSPKKSILINGMIHGREPVSMMMNLYIILHILTLPEQLLSILLHNTNLYFIPIINTDAYIINTNNYFSLNSTRNSYYRKNRHFDTSAPCEQDINNGVDLNRNFKVGFAYDDIGSSNNTCDEAYRGTFAFSEPETQAFRDFVIKHNDIVIAINYHTWGNLIITPYNYLTEEQSEQLLLQRGEMHLVLGEVYKEFEREAEYPKGFLFGNGMKTIQYTANGDCSDWLFDERKVLSFSPELGNGKKESDVFYPNRKVMFDIIEKNLPSALYAVQKTKYYLIMERMGSYYMKCDMKKYKESYLRGKKNKKFYNNNNNNNNSKDVFYCDSSVDEVLHFEIAIANKGFSDYVYNNNSNINDIDLHLNIAVLQMKTVAYWFIKNDTQEIQSYHIININTDNNKECLSSINSECSSVKINIDVDIPSRKNVILVIEVVCDRDLFYKQYGNKEHTLTEFNNNAQKTKDDIYKEILLSIYNNNQMSTIIPIYNSNNNNSYNEFKWKFNSPEVVFYYNNITEHSWLVIDTYNTNEQPFVTSTSLVICGCVLILILFLLYVIYTAFKENKAHHHILHEEQITIAPTNKNIIASNTMNTVVPEQEGNQHSQMYIELPNIPSNKEQVIS